MYIKIHLHKNTLSPWHITFLVLCALSDILKTDIFNAIGGEGNLAALQCPHILPGVLVMLSYCYIVILGVSVASTVHTMSPAASLYSHFQNIYSRSIFAQWKPSVKNPNTQKCQISSNILMSRALLSDRVPEIRIICIISGLAGTGMGWEQTCK